MSRRWRGKYEGESEASQEANEEDLDLAAKYARDLLKMNEDAQHEVDFSSKVLGYKMGSNEAKGVSQLPRSEPSPRIALTPQAHRRPSIASSQTKSPIMTARHVPANIHTSHELPRNSLSQFSPRAHITTPSPTYVSGRPAYRHPSISHTFNNIPFEHFPQNDELTAISHTLLGNEFMELDRIITLDGTDFSMGMGNGWPTYSGPQAYE